jgi:uncharacterized protein
MAYFCCQLRPPRTTFPGDMRPDERSAMTAHGNYIRDMIVRGVILMAGPVMDPAGSWGLCVAEGDTLAEAREVMDADPVVKAGLGFRYDIHPMPSLLRPDAEH